MSLISDIPIMSIKAIKAVHGGGGGGGGDVTGVKGSSETNYRTGNVNLTPGNIGTYTKEEIDTMVQEHSVREEELVIE